MDNGDQEIAEGLSRNLSHYLGAGATSRYPAGELDLSTVPAWQSKAVGDDEGDFDEREPSAPKADKYPSTPHLPFSPEVQSDDVVADRGLAQGILQGEIVITEKLDGGNCCLMDGQVYARTHSKPATHPWFGRVKQEMQWRWDALPEGLALFGECMVAMHSIKYDALTSVFYLFGVLDCAAGQWQSWDDVCALAEQLQFPTTPQLFRGHMSNLEEVRQWMEARASRPSAVGSTPGEGFVIRVVGAYHMQEFDRSIAKYVRKGHNQCDPNFKGTWQKQDIP